MANKYLDLTGLQLFCNKLRTMLNKINTTVSKVESYVDYAQSHDALDNIVNIDVNTRLHIVNLNKSSSLRLINGDPFSDVGKAGRDNLIIIKNIDVNDITVTMPSSQETRHAVLICRDSYTIPTGKHLEVSVVSDGNYSYYRVAEQN